MRTRALALVCLAVPGIGAAFEWTSLEVIDAPVTTISPSQGNPVVSDGDRWYVTYVKDGDVWIRVREEGVWLPPMQMESDPSTAVGPQLGNSQELVVLAWTDDRTGHLEIYTRVLEDGVWSPATCHGCDGTPSRVPALSHGRGGFFIFTDEVHMTWEEGPPAGAIIQRAIRDPGGWSTTVAVSSVPGAETPSVTDLFGEPVVTWIDHRSGDPVLYYRRGTGPEAAVAAPAGVTPENPSIHYEYCCSDFVAGTALILVEGVNGASRETYHVSIDDDVDDPEYRPSGTAGEGVSVDGFQFEGEPACGDFGGDGPDFFHVHSTPGDGVYTTYFSRVGVAPQYVALTDAALTPAAIAGVEGKPDAGLLAMWVEDVEGTPTLVARHGTELGGYSYDLEDPPDFVLVTPTGLPANELRLIDGYTGDPWTWPEDVGVRLSEALGDDLTLQFTTDYLYLDAAVDGDGRFSVRIPGGGCSQAGTAQAYCFWGPIAPEPQFHGAKSPDVDGDCIVTDADLAYVEAQLGTDDYCADLDGSGVVDPADVAIVELTHGDVCSFVGVDGGAEAPRPLLRVDRNPFRAHTTLRLALPGGASRVEVHDVVGRRVRTLAEALDAGGHVLAFDGRDDAGRTLAAGTYFVTVVTPEERRIHERLVMLP